jgi:hypothetical protein
MFRRKSVAKGLAAGAIGGLVGTIVMTQFQNAWQKASQSTQDMPNENQSLPEQGAGSESWETQTGTESPSGAARSAKVYSVRQGGARKSQSQDKEEEDNPTVKVADAVAGVGGKSLSSEQKKKAGTLVHYAFGTLMGAVYGLSAEMGARNIRRNMVISGLGFGSALFAGADEVAVPALRLSKSPGEVPVAQHVYGFASHLVYGTTAAAVFEVARKAL